MLQVGVRNRRVPALKENPVHVYQYTVNQLLSIVTYIRNQNVDKMDNRIQVRDLCGQVEERKTHDDEAPPKLFKIPCMLIKVGKQLRPGLNLNPITISCLSMSSLLFTSLGFLGTTFLL